MCINSYKASNEVYPSLAPTQLFLEAISSIHVYGEVIIKIPLNLRRGCKSIKHYKGLLNLSIKLEAIIKSKGPKLVGKFIASPFKNTNLSLSISLSILATRSVFNSPETLN